MKRASVLMFLIACGSPAAHGDDVDAGLTPDGAGSGSNVSPDAGLPVLGTTCPSKLAEVARITGAADAYPYTVHDVLVGKIDSGTSDDVVVVEDEYDSANSRTLLRFKAFLSNGTGFAAPVVSNAVFPQYGPEQVLLGDFNGDHLADIAIAYTDSEESSRVSYIYVAMQQADHTFVLGPAVNLAACRFSSDERYFALGVIDADHDGKDDLFATLSFDGLGAEPAALTLLKGTTSGLSGATCASAYPGQLGSAERIRIGDFDGDGTPDVMGLLAHTMVMYRNAGPGMLVPTANAVAYDSDLRYVVDPVGHGLIGLDVNTTNSVATRFATTGNGVATSGIGTFASESAPGGNYDPIRGFAVGDFNGDGLTDVIEVGNHNYSSGSPGVVSFGMACDRNARWDMVGGGFPDSVYKLSAIGFGGKTDVVVQDGSDLVVYQVNP